MHPLFSPLPPHIPMASTISSRPFLLVRTALTQTFFHRTATLTRVQPRSPLLRFTMSTSTRPTTVPPAPTLYIDGKWCDSSDSARRDVINPYDASVLTTVSEATTADALRAIQSSVQFFRTSSWSSQSHSSRCALLSRIADLLQRDRAELAHVEVLDTGKTLVEAETDVDDVTAVFRFYAEEALKLDSERNVEGEGIPQSVRSKILHCPVGVCVLISPWNYPLLQICWKLAPALATGNAVIIKPSEVTPMTTIHLTRLLLEAGVPSGAVQLLTAAGSSIGDTLTGHPDVDLVSFTGGLQTGKHIGAVCAQSIKRCTVELGGKNPNIVFADADLDRVADTVLTGVFLHAGQVCSSGARLIVEEPIADALVAEIVSRSKLIQLGNGLTEGTESGPLVSAAHLAKVQEYVALAKREGAVLLCGGAQPDPKQHPELAKGYFFVPTVLDRCDRSMRIVQEETFGPILTVERFAKGDEEAAVKLANDTKYGLAGGVQSGDEDRARRVARRLRHGTVWVNTYGAYTPRAEWGGFGWSGNGRELGRKGLDEYVETLHLYEETAPAKADWFKGKGKSLVPASKLS